MTDFYRKAAPAQIPTPHTHIPDRSGAGPTAPGGTPRSSARSNSDILSSQSHTTPAPTLFEKAPPVRRTGSLQCNSTPRGLTYAARTGERKRVRQTFTPREKDTWTKRWAPFATTRKQAKYDMFKAKFPSGLVPKRSTLFKWAKESVLPRRQLFAETEAGTTQPQLEPENVVAWTGRRRPKPKIPEEDERAIIVLVRLKKKHHLPVRACDLQQITLKERGVSISAACDAPQSLIVELIKLHGYHDWRGAATISETLTLPATSGGDSYKVCGLVCGDGRHWWAFVRHGAAWYRVDDSDVAGPLWRLPQHEVSRNTSLLWLEKQH